MIKKKSSFLVFLGLFILFSPGLLVSVTPNVGEYTGKTGYGEPMSFKVLSHGTQWQKFKLTFKWYSGIFSGTHTITVNGPGNINSGQFSYQSSTYSFTGNFTSANTASGTYQLNNYKVYWGIWIFYITGSDTWSATGSTTPEAGPPFGSFDTPIDGSTVSSSIAVTGWALDDSGIDNVKIYRAEGKQLLYIGDATLVEGARPDVAAAYPGYPNNTKAGWGYMLLTNFLPNSGNGTFVLHAIATDTLGNATTLGTKTIYCDNINAVKPFGAIDTPDQGGSASGSSFINWGWVLTPQPNSIPTDGSTINVYVDGVNLGHPTYNNYRADIASFFPGYANSNGAAGFFYLDTTGYENGVHTIQWTATDSGGNTDGIGSRYFTIQNTVNASSQSQNTRKKVHLTGDINLSPLPVEYYESIQVQTGYNKFKQLLEIYPDDNGYLNIQAKESNRVEIHFSTPISNISPLPVGSTLDTQQGIFYWGLGPGFRGDHEFMFVDTRGFVRKVNITVALK